MRTHTISGLGMNGRPAWVVLSESDETSYRNYNFFAHQDSAEAYYRTCSERGLVPTMRRVYCGLDGKSFDYPHLVLAMRDFRERELQ